MLKSIISNMDPVLLRISKVGNGCGFLLIVGYVLASMLSGISDPHFDQQRLVEEFGPLIFTSIAIGTLGTVLRMTFTTSSVSE
ncbi:hypothetical protein PSYCIT7_007260 [Pseudomonas syringae Cit 7]|uniref:Uncharacterized protein n=1 Tax=Pseudomonas syringae Cit 7 TaxID=629264 RepID=A0A8T8M174_PSESX|nr:hypothetical protein [Pseudomonas syringae]QUP67420.1 hypothetical protein PSYCIT7_007260 [Pseudomonas syringae Cit 7]SDS01921.1 hypothetical protein SAMN05421724_0477 [Pseudomonas syringae]